MTAKTKSRIHHRSRGNGHHQKSVVVSASPKLVKYLDTLVGTGLYGSTRNEVATRLVTSGIETLIERGAVERIPL